MFKKGVFFNNVDYLKTILYYFYMKTFKTLQWRSWNRCWAKSSVRIYSRTAEELMTVPWPMSRLAWALLLCNHIYIEANYFPFRPAKRFLPR